MCVVTICRFSFAFCLRRNKKQKNSRKRNGNCASNWGLRNIQKPYFIDSGINAIHDCSLFGSSRFVSYIFLFLFSSLSRHCIITSILFHSVCSFRSLCLQLHCVLHVRTARKREEIFPFVECKMQTKFSKRNRPNPNSVDSCQSD